MADPLSIAQKGGGTPTSVETDAESVLVSTLAWAIQRGIPLDEALLTIHSPWKHGYRIAARRLKRGESLTAALRYGLGRRLPSGLLKTLARAERDGELITILPHLADTLKLSAGLRRERRKTLFYPALQFSIVAIMLGMVSVLIFPQYLQIYHYMLGESLSKRMFPFLYIYDVLIATICVPMEHVILLSMILASVIIVVKTYCSKKMVIVHLGYIYITVILLSVIEALIFMKYGDYYAKGEEEIYLWASLTMGLIFIHFFAVNIITIGNKYIRGVAIIAPGLLYITTSLLGYELISGIYLIFVLISCPIIIITSILQFIWNIASSSISNVPLHLALPITGVKISRRLPLCELSTGMYVHLSAGKGMAEAAELSRDTVARWWVRGRLDRFVAEVRAGAYWPDAWARMRLGSPLHEWMIRNAAAREKPAEGFLQLTAWLCEEIRQEHHLFLRFAEVCGILFNACLVGLFAYSIFNAMIGAIHLLSIEAS